MTVIKFPSKEKPKPAKIYNMFVFLQEGKPTVRMADVHRKRNFPVDRDAHVLFAEFTSKFEASELAKQFGNIMKEMSKDDS